MNAPEPCDCYVFGSFRIDRAGRTLVRDGQPVPLAPKSFDLLWTLVENSGKLLDKTLLLNSVWPDTAVEENSLAKAITKIRKALGERPKENRFIATVSRRGYRFIREVTRPTTASEPIGASRHHGITLAVLPFAWLTREGRDSSLSIGVADALIARLSNLPQLIVRPTTSILDYVDAPSPLDLAKLGADFIVTGSLQQVEERVRVTVQMVRQDQQRSVWADRFEETLTHIFAIEDTISERVAAALALTLTAEQRQLLRRHGARSEESWQLYLRGRYLLGKRALPAAQSAIACFRKALEIDPDYAQASVGIAEAYILIGLHGALTGWLPPHDTYPEAKRAASRALEIDSACAEAYAALGFISFIYEWDPAAAMHQFGRSLSLHPHYVPAHH